MKEDEEGSRAEIELSVVSKEEDDEDGTSTGTSFSPKITTDSLTTELSSFRTSTPGCSSSSWLLAVVVVEGATGVCS